MKVQYVNELLAPETKRIKLELKILNDGTAYLMCNSYYLLMFRTDGTIKYGSGLPSGLGLPIDGSGRLRIEASN